MLMAIGHVLLPVVKCPRFSVDERHVDWHCSLPAPALSSRIGVATRKRRVSHLWKLDERH